MAPCVLFALLVDNVEKMPNDDDDDDDDDEDEDEDDALEEDRGTGDDPYTAFI